MSLLSLVLLVGAVIVVLGAEWPRVARLAGSNLDSRGRRGREQRKSKLRVIRGGSASPGAGTAPGTGTAANDADDFVASVRRDLERLPTFDRDANRDR